MRATGIIRRMDDLGRVVIPKEIRRQMGIKEGDPLEIFTEGDGICFKPYHADNLSELKSVLIKMDHNAHDPEQWKLINEMRELVKKYEKI